MVYLNIFYLGHFLNPKEKFLKMKNYENDYENFNFFTF